MRPVQSIAMLLCLFAVHAVRAEHNPLLPHPQQVQFGSGSVSLTGMTIAFSSTPSAADQFAAQELSRYMDARAGVRLAIDESGSGAASGPVILLDRTDTKDQPLALPGDKPGPNSSQAYDLSVTSHGVKIHARSSAGIFYGIQTLRQLVEGHGSTAVLPEVEIHDWPSLAFRGTMVDISHGPLPTEQEIERQIDFLARWKENQYYIYSEDSIELKGYPLINPDGRLSQDEVRRIVAYGRQRHIDVIPDFDLYAHEHDLFRIEKYSTLSDEPHGTEFDAGNPDVKPLLTDWINQFAELFPSPFVSGNFRRGCDGDKCQHRSRQPHDDRFRWALQLPIAAGGKLQRFRDACRLRDVCSVGHSSARLSAVALVAVPARAQITTGRISGTVTDPSGAVSSRFWFRGRSTRREGRWPRGRETVPALTTSNTAVRAAVQAEMCS